VTALAIVSGVAVAVLLFVIVADALRRPGDERDPEQPHNADRARSSSEAAAAAPISDVDEQAAAPLLAYVEEIGSGEFPALAFDADPLGAPIPETVQHADPALFNVSAAAWLLPAWPTAPTVPLSSVQVAEPDPLLLDGPTVVWTQDWIAQVLAGGPR
jgi:hypothetical protein